MSKVTALMQDEDLCGLLKISRAWNEAHDITGMLLYVEGQFLNHSGGRFIQAIEGSEEEVKYIFEKIRQDKHHHSIVILSAGNIINRNFENWSMGFKSMQLAECRDMPGYFELNKGFLTQTAGKKHNVALTFLKSFYSLQVSK